MKILIFSAIPYLSNCSIDDHSSNVTDFLLNVAMFNDVRYVEYRGGINKTFEWPFGISCRVVDSLEDLRKEIHKQIKDWKPDVVHSSYYDLFLIDLKEKYVDIKIGFHCWEPVRPEGETILNSGEYNYRLSDISDLYLLVDYVLFAQGDHQKRRKRLLKAKNLHYISQQYDPLYIPTEEELSGIKKIFMVSYYGALEVELKKKMFEELFLEPALCFPMKFSSNIGKDRYPTRYGHCSVESPFLPHSKLYRAYSESFYGLQIFGWTEPRLSLGVKPIEQAASGCATLVQKNPDIEELVINGKTGFIVETTEDIIEACELAINNPDEVREMGIKAKEFIKKKYSPKALNEKLQKIWGV